jgi:carbamoyltransferase
VIVLGVSGGHDANWCVMRDGEVLGAFEKERFTGVRHDGGEITALVPETLAYLGLSIADVDLIATGEPVHRGKDAGPRKLAGAKYRRPDEWVHQVVEFLGRILPCVSVPHHLSHAAYARYASSEPATTVITWDGGGDFYTEDAYCSTSVSRWDGQKLVWLRRLRNSDLGSLWFTYARAIFGDGNHSGKLMGLAALGSDRLTDQMRELFIRPLMPPFEGGLTVKDCWPDYDAPPLIKGELHWSEPLAADIAYAVQEITTEACLSIASRAAATAGGDALALSGGVALNGYANTAIQTSGLFGQVFIPPAVNDGGIAVGAALFATHHVMEVPWRPGTQPTWAFLGMGCSREDAAQSLRETAFDWRAVEQEEAEHLAAVAMADHKVVAWFQGRAEHGPRALGNRSILALPADGAMKDHINAKIKYREPFRPLAPAVPQRVASTYFGTSGPSPWMMHIVPAEASCRSAAPAAVHADGTARVQTVDTSTPLGRITEEVGELTGTPVVLNTSLNVRTPIVNAPAEAVAAFAATPMDVLFLEGHMAWKKTPIVRRSGGTAHSRNGGARG